MPTIVLALTDAGLAAVQAASGSAPTVIAEVGLSNTPFAQAPTLTALPGEFKRIGAVSGTAVATNIVHMTAYDVSADVYDATGFGLFLADGTLLATYSSADPVMSKAELAFALFAVDIAFENDLAASIAFGDAVFAYPPASESVPGVVELASVAEAQAGIDALRALTPAAARAAILGWLLQVDGAGSGLDADKLDGQHGAYYLAAGSYTEADVLAKLLTVDGPASGIDADLLDGYQGASYDRIVAISLIENGGYVVFASGYKRCWGTVTCAANGATSVTYPISFSSFSNAQFSGAHTAANVQDNNPSVSAVSLGGCTIFSALDVPLSGWWQAEGN